MAFHVEVTDDATEKAVGYLDRETDENPNNNRETAVYDDVSEVRQAIQASIDEIGTGFSYVVEDNVTGDHHGVVYYQGERWEWEI